MIISLKVCKDVPSTCFIIRFNNLSDYGKVHRHLDTPFYWNSENVYVYEDSLLEIHVDVADSYRETFLNDILNIDGLSDLFIMTQDLNEEPDYVFVPATKEIRVKKIS